MNSQHHPHGETGVSMRRYTVFTGIDLLFIDVQRESIQFQSHDHSRIFAINHCEDGRIECKFNSGEYLYMETGDMSIGWHVRSDYQHYNFFPTKYFKGLILLIDVDKAQPVLDGLIPESPIQLSDLANRFCEHSEYGMLMSESNEVRQIFSSLYDVPESIRYHLFRLKVLEIFLLLSVISTEKHEKKISFRKQQVDLVKGVKEFIGHHYDKRMTIDELANQFDMPTSTLKRCFKGVFGVTIHQFIKECRIREAKRLLNDTDQPILQIANGVGYENGSKFTSAFKEAVGITPRAYRQRHM